MSNETTTAPAQSRPRRPRVAPQAPARPTLPATDAANSDVPLTLSADAVEGTRDRGLAMDWTDQGHVVRRRSDGVYEKVHVPVAAGAAEPETYEFYPDLEMLDRRVLDPTVHRSVPVLFKDEVLGAPKKYYKRWVDTHTPHRLLTLTQAAYYKKAEWSMLKDKQEIGDRFEGTGTDPYVRRGEKGRYMLLFMPYAKWLEIKTAQANLRTKRERSEMTRLAATQAAGTPGIGAQGAEQIDSMFRGTIRELPPQSIEAFQGSGLPKDLATGEATVLEE